MPDFASRASDRQIGHIPVRNLWILMLYASDLTRISGALDAMVDPDINDIPELIARLLTNAVEQRLRRNLTRGYYHRERALTRVRGRINFLETESRQLLPKGEIFCRYEELTIDTPRNRLVRAALELMTQLVGDSALIRQCRALAATLGRAGVGGHRPSRAELAADEIGRNDAADRFMVALARLAFDLALPAEDPGSTPLFTPDREEAWVRRLFEKAILGFARVEFEPLGYVVRGGVPLEWQISGASAGLPATLPRMLTDIVIDVPAIDGRLIIDTKFTSVLGTGRFGDASLKSGYLYQMYAYLRSQEGRDSRSDTAAGMLLHPAIDLQFREHAVIQNHPIIFATIDLCGQPATIRDELRRMLCSDFWRHGKQPEQCITRAC